MLISFFDVRMLVKQVCYRRDEQLAPQCLLCVRSG